MQLRIPEDTNSVSDELLLSAANAIDSSSVLPKTAPKPQTGEKQVGASKGKYSKTALFKRVIYNIILKCLPLFSLIIYINHVMKSYIWSTDVYKYGQIW